MRALRTRTRTHILHRHLCGGIECVRKDRADFPHFRARRRTFDGAFKKPFGRALRRLPCAEEPTRRQNSVSATRRAGNRLRGASGRSPLGTPVERSQLRRTASTAFSPSQRRARSRRSAEIGGQVRIPHPLAYCGFTSERRRRRRFGLPNAFLFVRLKAFDFRPRHKLQRTSTSIAIATDR